MKIKNSNGATGSFSDDEHMPHDYEVVFDEADGTVATVRQEVGESLVASEEYPTIEAVDGGNASETAESGDADSDTNGSDNE